MYEMDRASAPPYHTNTTYCHSQPHDPFHYAPNQGCNVNITMDTTEQADDVRAEAERIIQRRRDAAAAKRKAEQPITNNEFESLKHDFTRTLRVVIASAILPVCYVQIETLKFPPHM